MRATVTVMWMYLGLEIEAEVTVDYLPPTPARTYGPPEDCYPGDGLEIQAVIACTIQYIDGIAHDWTLTPQNLAELDDDAMEAIETALYDYDYHRPKRWRDTDEYADMRDDA